MDQKKSKQKSQQSTVRGKALRSKIKESEKFGDEYRRTHQGNNEIKPVRPTNSES